MEQLINTATIPYYASAILLALGATLLGIIVLTFIVEGKRRYKEKDQTNNCTIYYWNALTRFRILLQRYL